MSMYDRDEFEPHPADEINLNTRLKASLRHQALLDDAWQTYEQDSEAYKKAFLLYDAAYNKMKDSHRRWMELRRKAGL